MFELNRILKRALVLPALRRMAVHLSPRARREQAVRTLVRVYTRELDAAMRELRRPPVRRLRIVDLPRTTYDPQTVRNSETASCLDITTRSSPIRLSARHPSIHLYKLLAYKGLLIAKGEGAETRRQAAAIRVQRTFRRWRFREFLRSHTGAYQDGSRVDIDPALLASQKKLDKGCLLF